MGLKATTVLALETGAAVVAMGAVEGTRFAPRDFMVYDDAARALRLHPTLDIYRCVPAPTFAAIPACVDPHQIAFLYPPIFTVFFEPFTLLPLTASILLWYVLNGAMLAGALVLMQALWPRSPRTFVGTCAALLLSLPFLNGVQWGQVHILLLLGYVLVLWLARSERGRWAEIGAGGVLAALIAIKLIPALLLVYLVARRKWWAVASTAAALAAGALVVAVVSTPLEFVYWWRALHGPVAQLMASISQGVVTPLGLWFTSGVLAVYGAALWLGRRDAVGGFLWTLCTLLVISPVVWIHYLTWLVLPFVAWWVRGTLWLRLYIALCFASLYLAPANPIPAILLSAWLIQGWLLVEPVLAPALAKRKPAERVAPAGEGG